MCFLLQSKYNQSNYFFGMGGEGGEKGGGHKGSSFCGTPAKGLQKLQPATSKNISLEQRDYQDSQVAIYIDPNF